MTVVRGCRRRLHTSAAVAFCAATLALAGTAQAGECPAGKRMAGATKPVSTPAKDVSDKLLAAIDLGKEKVALADHQLRLRKLEIQPGGVVPWHSHADRPALIYIISGQIYEYASDCAVPILHKAGEVATETSSTDHWWQNAGKTTVVLLSADLMHDKTDHNM